MIVHPDYLGFKRRKKRVWFVPHPLFLMENEIEQDKDVKDEYSEVICYHWYLKSYESFLEVQPF